MSLIVALTLPLLLCGVGVAVDFGMLAMKHQKLQSAADTASLAAAKELGIASSTDATISAAASNYVITELASSSDSAATSAVAVDHKAGSVTVNISESWTPFFAQFISSGVTPINVTATAKLAGSTNICVLALNGASNKNLLMDTNSKVTATGCGIYSDSVHANGITINQNAVVTADLVCSAGGVKIKNSSSITPAALTNCPVVADPLAGRMPPAIGACDYNNTIISSGSLTLLPGHYCGGLKVTGTAQVTLTSGTYIISGKPLEVSGNASFMGDHVGFYLDGSASIINFTGTSTVSLTGATNAEMSGLLFFEDRAAPADRQHRINAANASNLTGTIYLPQGYLKIDPNSKVAAQSAYTAIIANRIELSAAPELVLNSDYGATDVPVPAGVRSSNSVVLVN